MQVATGSFVFLARVVCVIALVGISLAPPTGAAQDSLATPVAEDVVDGRVELVTAAFIAADYDALLNLAYQRIEIQILGQGARYSHSQAAMVLRDFFRQHPPGRVELSEHLATDDDMTARGRYWTRSGGTPLLLDIGFRMGREGLWQLGSIRVVRPSFERSASG